MGSSRVEDILQAGLDGTELPTAVSRVEILLKEWIEQGGNIDDILVAGSNITLTKNADGTITIDASGEVSSEDTVARAAIAAIKDGETLDSFGDVETALIGKADTTDIPTVPITTIQKNGTGIIPVSGTVNIAVPTSAADVSALPDTTKYAAALSLTINSSTFVMTGQLKDQNGDNLGIAQTIDLPLESVVVGGSYNSQTKKVVLTLQNGNTIEFGVADLVSGLQTELSASNKLNPAYINYDSTHRAVSDTEKSTWNGKQNAINSSHKLSADLVDDANATNKFATAAELEQISTNKNNISRAQAQANINTNYGVKNILNTSFISGEVRGVTYTLNADGSVTVNGTANSYGSTIYIFDGLISAGNYVLSIGNAIGSGNYVTLIYSDDTKTSITGNGTSAQLNNKDIKSIYVYIAANTSIDLTIYPMITPKALYVADTTYKPYAMDNAELTAAIQALQAQVANQ